MGTEFYVQNNQGARLGSTDLEYMVPASYLVIDGNTVADPNNGVYIPTSPTNPTLTSPTLYQISDGRAVQLIPAQQEANTQELIVPANFNVNNTIFFADSLDSDGLTAPPIPTGSLGWITQGGLAWFEHKYGLNTVETAMVNSFASGGSQDFQTTYENIAGVSNGGKGPFVKAFIDAASWNLGLTAYLAGIPLWAVELGGGLYNHFNNKSGDQSGIFFNSAVNANSIEAGYSAGPSVGLAGTLPNNPFSVVNGIDTIATSDGNYIQVTSTSTSITLNFFNSSNQPTSTTVFHLAGNETDTTYQMNAGNLTSTTNVYNTSQNLTEVITTEPASLATNVTQITTNYTGNTNDAVDGYVFDFTDEDGSNNSISFAAGTFSAPSYSDSSSVVNIGLTTSGGLNLGTLTFNASTDADSFTLTDGKTVTLPDLGGNTEITADPGDTPFGTLQSYLSDLGYSGDLVTANYQANNPTGTAYDVDGVVTGVIGSDWAVAYQPTDGPGAVLAGQDTATDFGFTADAYNYAFVANGGNVDFSNDTISNMQALTLGTGSGALASMTAAQFNDFDEITGAGVITITTAGTVSLAGPGSGGDDGNSDDDDVSEPTNTGSFDLVAQGWGGTNLIGDNTNNQILQASQFGDDTLTEGNGNDDILIAGEGVDELTAGTGTGDQFSANDGLSSGSGLTANGTDATLTASGDISGANIAGIEFLQVGSSGVAPPDITMTADEFNAIPTIYSVGTMSITINDSGVYSIDADNIDNASQPATRAADVAFGATETSYVTINATNSAAQYNTYDATGSGDISLTLDGNGGQSGVDGTGLVASGSGNDTLIAISSGGGYSLSATGSGNDTLTAGNGSGDGLSATGAGTDTLTAGYGENDTLSASGDGTYSLSAGEGSGDGLSLNASDSSVSAEGADATISVTGSDNTVTASGAGDAITAQGGSNTITTTGGGATVNLYDTDNIVSGGASGSNTYNLLGISNGDADFSDYDGLTLNGGTGGGNVLNVDDSTLDLTQAEISNVSISGMSTLIAGTGDLTPLTGLSFANGTGTLQATEAGTYDVSSLDTSDEIDMEDTSTSGGVTLIDNNANGDQLSGAANDTLTAGSGSDDAFFAEGANDVVTTGNGAGDGVLISASGVTATLGSGAGDTVQDDGNNDSVALGSGGDTVQVLGSSDAVTSTGNDTITLGGSTNALTLENGASGSVTITGTGDTATVAGASSGSITFDSDTLGTLLLQSAQDFTGTVAGFGSTDSIDLTNFDFADGATIGSVTGNGDADTNTVLTISDNGVSTQIALLNQYANQFSTSASAYTLSADSLQPNAGTLLQLAASH